MKQLEIGDRLAAEARERAEKATKGPSFRCSECGHEGLNIRRSGCCGDQCPSCGSSELESLRDPLRKTIASEDAPALCAEVERRGEAIRQAVKLLCDCDSHAGPDHYGDCPAREVAAILEGR